MIPASTNNYIILFPGVVGFRSKELKYADSDAMLKQEIPSGNAHTFSSHHLPKFELNVEVGACLKQQPYQFYSWETKKLPV